MTLTVKRVEGGILLRSEDGRTALCPDAADHLELGRAVRAMLKEPVIIEVENPGGWQGEPSIPSHAPEHEDPIGASIDLLRSGFNFLRACQGKKGGSR